MINYAVAPDGIATLEWDLPGRSQNLLNPPSMAAFGVAAQQALADPAVQGILIASAKADFITGVDLDWLFHADDAQALSEQIKPWHKLLRALESSGKPVAAALNGSALGGGLELALACHYRVAAEQPQARFGFPEVALGLLPGAGGTQRTPRLIGIQTALRLLSEGQRLPAALAQQQGLIHAVVPNGDQRAAARTWLLAAVAKNAASGKDGKPGKTLQPWDQRGFKIPGGGVMTPAGMQTFMTGNAMLRAKTMGNYPAPQHCLSCVFEGLQTDIDTGLAIETRYFIHLVRSPQTKNMLRSLFFFMQEENPQAQLPDFLRASDQIPVALKDTRDPYTRRVCGAYLCEGVALLQEGVAPALIDNAGRLAGMPVGPLALADEVSVEWKQQITRQTKAGLGAKYPPRAQQPTAEQVIERLLLIQSLEALRCLEEGVLSAPPDADVGAILGWGYPPFRGGPIGHIHTLGVATCVQRCQELAQRHGPRFSPPERLLQMMATGARFYPV